MTKTAEANKILIFVVIGVVILAGFYFYFSTKKISIKTSEINCDEVEDINQRDQCITSFALKSGNSSLCENIAGETNCITQFAITSGNRSLCDSIVDTIQRMNCFLQNATKAEVQSTILAMDQENKSTAAFFAASIYSDPAYCDLQDENYDFVLSGNSYQSAFSNKSTPTAPVSGDLKFSDLKRDLAISSGDVCKFSLANNGVPSACSSILSKDFSSVCLSTSDANACSGVSGNGAKILCSAISEKDVKKCEDLIPLSKSTYLFCLENIKVSS